MQGKSFSRQSLIEFGTLSVSDLKYLTKYRGAYNRLGFAYQLLFVKLFNTLPQQEPFEILEELVIYASAQLEIDGSGIHLYKQNRKKIRVHQKELLQYLGWSFFNKEQQILLSDFVFKNALQISSLSLLHIKVLQFLRDQRCLCPTENVLHRLIASQRQKARHDIFNIIKAQLSCEMIDHLNALLVVHYKISPLERLKQAPLKASADSIGLIANNLKTIEETGVLSLDLSGVNNNYQRIFAKEVKRISISRLRDLEPIYRYCALVCFLYQCYQDHLDFLTDSYIKLMTWSNTRARNQAEKEILLNNHTVEESLKNYECLKAMIRDQNIPNEKLRQVIYDQLGKEIFEQEICIPVLKQGKSLYVFQLMKKKYSYFRQFTPIVLQHLKFHQEEKTDLIEAIEILKKLNTTHQRKLPAKIPVSFIPKKLRKNIIQAKNQIDRHGWECSLYLKLRDDIKNGNLIVQGSKRFVSIKDFFMPHEQWSSLRSEFFAKAQLPEAPEAAELFLTQRLNQAYDSYFEKEVDNHYARIENGKWILSTDALDTSILQEKERIKKLKGWIQDRLISIKLPDLLIKVDNELNFTKAFLFSKRDKSRLTENICAVIVAIMAHGCNIGANAMTKITEGVSYEQIRRITDWQLTDEALTKALSWIVNAISKLGITSYWGEGKTSSSDAHLKTFHQKVLQQNYSPPFGDFALEFYTFVADNFAPFYGKPIESTEGEALHVLDGILYNESDLPLEEHYTDTKAAAKILFTAFSFFGKVFNPRIRGIQNHLIYRIDKNKDYKSLTPLLKHKNNKIQIDLIKKYWDQIAWFYASIESGYVTASVALRRLLTLNESNEFYKACLQYGNILKTEHILHHMTDPQMRYRKRVGLLKGEQMHQLARDVHYADGGKVKARDLRGQRLTCTCLTLIMACIVYWQTKELMRVTDKYLSEEGEKEDLGLLAHISPIGWYNIIIYGDYIINRKLVQAR